MVVAAKIESVFGSLLHHQVPSLEFSPAFVPGPKPKVERPRARRIMVSKCSSAAVVDGDDDSTDKEVELDVVGSGAGRWVARNMW